MRKQENSTVMAGINFVFLLIFMCLICCHSKQYFTKVRSKEKKSCAPICAPKHTQTLDNKGKESFLQNRVPRVQVLLPLPKQVLMLKLRLVFFYHKAFRDLKDERHRAISPVNYIHFAIILVHQILPA